MAVRGPNAHLHNAITDRVEKKVRSVDAKIETLDRALTEILGSVFEVLSPEQRQDLMVRLFKENCRDHAAYVADLIDA